MKKPIKAVVPSNPNSPIMWHPMKTSFGKPKDNIIYHPIKTSFGSHSIMWHTLQTAFGSHSLIGKKVDESVSVKSFSQFNENSNTMKDFKEFVPHYERNGPGAGEHEFNLDNYNLKVHVPRGIVHRGIRDYTAESTGLNSTLHKIKAGTFKPEQSGNYEQRKNIIEEMDATFADKKNHVGINHDVFTGLHKSPQKIFDEDRANNPNHDPSYIHTHSPAFTSTSTNLRKAKNFAVHDILDPDGAYGHILHIRVPKDHPSISTKESSWYPLEDEVLLHRGTRLKIHANPEKWFPHGKENHVQYKIWHADVVGHHMDELPEPLPYKHEGVDY